ncbi:MAG: kynureninase [Acidimicrobiia bacterium]
MDIGSVGTSFDAALALDARDPIAWGRDRFWVPDRGVVYLDGNSLGRLPLTTRDRLRSVIDDDWGTGLIRSWDHWMDWPTQVGDRLAEHVLGARPGEVIISDSTTVNFYKLAVAALDARPDRRVVVLDRNNFPTDRYVIETLAAQRQLHLRWIDGHPIDGVSLGDVVECLDDDVALVTLSHVEYRNGALVDLAGITAATHEVGALTLWDLSHSAGSVPIDLGANDVDLAVGCSYKYLNAGPGAPAYLYVRSSLQSELTQPVTGWMGHRDVFAMGPGYEPDTGVRRFLAGTPSVLGLAAIDEGVSLVAEAGIDAIRVKGQDLTDYAVMLHDEWLAPLGFTLGSPRGRDHRGAHVSVCRRDARDLCVALRDRQVIPDFREPDSVRLGLSPLSTSFADVWKAMDSIRSIAGPPM